jgi:predicted transcriptional regulator YheO
MDEHELLFEAAFRVADTIGQTFGSFCEIAVHDLRIPTHSLVHLVNGEVTGRELGEPIRDLIYRVLPEMDATQAGLFNYVTELSDGRRLKSSTCLIRDSGGAALIALCINLDVTGLDAAALLITEMSLPNGLPARPAISKTAQSVADVGDDVTEILKQLVTNIVRPIGHPDAGALTKRDRLAIVEFLERKGAFRIKGAVALVATELGASEATVYRDLDVVRRRLYTDEEKLSLSEAMAETTNHPPLGAATRAKATKKDAKRAKQRSK